MEDSRTRKRTVPTENKKPDKYTIYEQVFILSNLRSEIPKICDALSVSIRVAILSDLAFLDLIYLKDGKIEHKPGLTHDTILDEVHCLIFNTHLSPKDLLVALNGESYTKAKWHLHVKKLRSKISKRLEERGILRYEKNKYKFFKGKVHIEEKVRKDIFESIIEYVDGKSYCLKMEVLISCLLYCDAIKPIMFSMPAKKVHEVQGRIDGIRKKYMESVSRSEEPDSTIFPFLRVLFKL